MIKELSLAMNKITDIGAEKIAEFLDYSGSALKSLSLHWNKIKYRGGIKIAEALVNNETLKVLDLSWNLIGKWQLTNLGQLPMSEIKKKLKNQPQQSIEEAYSKLNFEQANQIDEQIGKIWGQSLKENETLIHLDLSNNDLSEMSCRLIGKEIHQN